MSPIANATRVAGLTKAYCQLARAASREPRARISKLDFVRFYFAWMRSMLATETIHAGSPWVTFSAIRFMDRVVSRCSSVFEYGCGGSTLFFSRRVRELVTVEHDREWLDRTSSAIQPGGDFVWHSHFEPPTSLGRSSLPSRDPDSYGSSASEFAGMSFEAYARSIDRYPDDHFDLVLIDGRARPACYKHAVSKVKQGGHIVLDNAERDEYEFIEQHARTLGYPILDFWGPGPYNKYVWRTIVIQKQGRITGGW